MKLLCTVKRKHLIKLPQPVIDTTFQFRWFFPALAFAMGHQRTAYPMFLTSLDEIPQCYTGLLYSMAMEVKSRLNFVFSLTQIFIDAMLHPRAREF